LLPDLPRCEFSPAAIPPGEDCAVLRPDIPLRNAFFSDLRRLSTEARERAVSLDAGSNSGDFSKYIAKIGHKVARGRHLHLVMIDPQPRMARRLAKLAWQLSNISTVNATFLPVAAWTRAGNATFLSSSHSSVESSFSRSQAGHDSDAQVVRTIDLAAYLRADFFAGASLRLLKIVSAAIAHRISSQGL
jgi:FkbM family methyltransferase